MLLSVRGLAIGYGDEPLQRDLDFEVQREDVFVILGGSGCGKSTLLRHLIGLEEPMAGSIEVSWQDQGAPPYGVMFQGGALFSSMTLLDNVALPLQRWTELASSSIEDIARARLHLVGLGGFENHLPADISGGMKKRAGIARALALEPQVLFLDEPSAGLDPIMSVELDDLILTLRDGLHVTTVMVTHELESILRVASTCIMLDAEARSIIARGDPRTLKRGTRDPRVRRFFNRLPSTA